MSKVYRSHKNIVSYLSRHLSADRLNNIDDTKRGEGKFILIKFKKVNKKKAVQEIQIAILPQITTEHTCSIWKQTVP